jgi:hypothetical protein
MNIVLTQKDADSILSYFRDNLQTLNDYEETFPATFEDFQKQFCQCDNSPDESRDAYDEQIKMMREERSLLIHFIELLTCGSEGSNGTS